MSRAPRTSLRPALWRLGLLFALFAGACGDRRQLALFAPLEGPDAGTSGADRGDRDSDYSRRCDSASDCTDERPFCEPNEERCVECRTSDDCDRDESCRFEDHACVPSCRDAGDCAGSGRPICAMSAGVCVECTNADDCRDSEPFCNLRTGRCVECLYDGDCNDSQECVRGECQR